jgi:hypothetical protein
MASVSTTVVLPGDPVATHLLVLTADTLHDALRATRDDDRVGARRIWRRRARRRAVRAVGDAMRTRGRGSSVSLVRVGPVNEDLHFLEQLLTINELLDGLTSLVARGGGGRLSDADCRDLELLGHAGSERLLRLAAGLDAPNTDTAYRRCGEELISVLEALTDRHAWPSGAVDAVALCGDLTFTVLAVSRRTTRVS